MWPQSFSFFRCGVVFQTYMMHPNILRWCTADFFPYHASNGVMPSMLFVGNLFSTYTTVLIASPQNHPERPLTFSMLLAVATTEPF
jgi:hypothetical protein